MSERMTQFEVSEARFARVESQVSALTENMASLSADVRTIAEAVKTQAHETSRLWEAQIQTRREYDQAGKPKWGVILAAVGSLGAFITLYVDPVRELVFANKEMNQTIQARVHEEDVRRARWEGRIETALNLNGDTFHVRPD